MSDDVNKSLALAMSEQGIQPAGTPSDSPSGPILPSGTPTTRPVQGQPDIKDKTQQALQQPQQQQPAAQPAQSPDDQQRTTVPLTVLQEERNKRQELEKTVKNVNAQNQDLNQQLATLNSQMQNLAAQFQGQQVQQQQQQQAVADPAPDIMLEPNEWTDWMLRQVDNVIMQRLMGIVDDAFKQRMMYFNQKAIEKYGSDVVAKATNWMVQQGRRNEAIAHFDPTEYSVLAYYQQQGINHFAADHTGRLDPKTYNERFTGQLLQAPGFWDQVASNPEYQQQFAQAYQRTHQQQPQGQQPAQQQPQGQVQPVVYPQQFQQPQAQQPGQPAIPPSMVGQTGAGGNNITPLPTANDDLRNVMPMNRSRAANGMA